MPTWLKVIKNTQQLDNLYGLHTLQVNNAFYPGRLLKGRHVHNHIKRVKEDITRKPIPIRERVSEASST